MAGVLDMGGKDVIGLPNPPGQPDAAASKAYVDGGTHYSVVTKTHANTPYAVAAGDYAIIVDTSGGAVEIDLPAAASHTGRVLNIKKKTSDANSVTIKANGAELIDGANTVVFSSQYTSYQIISDGTQW